MSQQLIELGENEVIFTSDRHGTVYHTDPTCNSVQSMANPVIKDKAVLPTYGECSKCSGEAKQQGEATTKQCDLCGQAYKYSPNHLRSCPGLE